MSQNDTSGDIPAFRGGAAWTTQLLWFTARVRPRMLPEPKRAFAMEFAMKSGACPGIWAPGRILSWCKLVSSHQRR